jgi:hypothetical protein
MTPVRGGLVNSMISKKNKAKREMAVRLLKPIQRSVGTRIDLRT